MGKLLDRILDSDRFDRLLGAVEVACVVVALGVVLVAALVGSIR